MSMSDAFQQVVRGLELPPPDWTASPETLLYVPATAGIKRELELLEDALSKQDGGLNLAISNTIARVSRLLAGAQARDALAAETCERCLGLGGRGRQTIVWPASDPEAPLQGWSELCGCSYGEALTVRLIAESEAGRRRVIQERVARLWQQAKVPLRFRGLTLDTWLERRGNAREALAAAGDLVVWAASRRWLYLYGPVGTGKTGLVCVLAEQMIRELGRTVVFVCAPDLLDALKDTYRRYGQAADHEQRERLAESESDLLGALVEADLLILDDLGAQHDSAWAIERLSTLINRRYNAGAQTAVTSNLAPVELSKAMGPRAPSRLIDDADVICLDGPDLRLA